MGDHDSIYCSQTEGRSRARSWSQPQEASHLTALSESMWVFDRQHIRQRDQIAYPFHLFEQFRLRIRLPGYFFDPPIVFLNSFIQ